MSHQAAEADVQARDGIQGVARVEIATDGPQGFVERRARIDGVEDSVLYGVSPAWREHYGITDPDQFPPRATTNDVFVASLASCLLAVYAGALEARGITVHRGDLTSIVNYDIGPVEGASGWVIRTVDILYSLRLAGEGERATAQRVLGFYEAGCPLSQTLRGGPCKISANVEFV